MFILPSFLFLAVWDYPSRRRAADVLPRGGFYGLHGAKPFHFAFFCHLDLLRKCNRISILEPRIAFGWSGVCNNSVRLGAPE